MGYRLAATAGVNPRKSRRVALIAVRFVAMAFANKMSRRLAPAIAGFNAETKSAKATSGITALAIA